MRIINISKKAFLITSMAAFLSSCEKEEMIPTSELPTEIASYVSTHFPDNRILQVVKDKDGLTKTYDLILEGSISLEFNRDKEIIDIDANSKLPDSVIPEKLRLYVIANYPSNVITDWEIEEKKQQIELENGIGLEFNMNGDFLRIDN